ncbi:uncharacterized protein LOC127754110 [Oryza glaberrima]|uniref:uncharacterized protein LOC127754110 n=1 Tax=Oryza glaberrima TaxID=4538 RepID=UPI00224BFE2C|nr:uncharacterized protein LOC127754110 [Oryza glaberrima]
MASGAALGQLQTIVPLDGSNYTDWKNTVLLNLAMLDYDLALREDIPEEPQTTEELDMNEEDYENVEWNYKEKLAAWEKSNRMSLMYIKNHIAKEIIGGIVDSDNAKAYLANIEENFKSSSKTYASTIISKMITSSYNGKGSVRKHILEMTHMAHQLKSMDMDVTEGFLVHFIMSSLGPDFGPFKINYNTQKEKWTIQELIHIQWKRKSVRELRNKSLKTNSTSLMPITEAKERCIKENPLTVRRISRTNLRSMEGITLLLKLQLVLLRVHIVLSVTLMDIGKEIAHVSKRG